MIDGDDIISIASETGYRLCSCDNTACPPSTPSFSTAWCPNDRNIYYSCTRNGFCKAVNTTKNTVCTYEVLFRQFSATLDQDIQPGRHISLHWDKMSLIPSRPGELLFLLGVSKCLFYTAFPGSVSPLAVCIQNSSTGFTYGTPVLEIVSHACRITAVEVSQRGHILATGDEQGRVKLMMLCRPDSLKHTISRKSLDALCFGMVDGELDTQGVQCHRGPIFSMQWLDMMVSDGCSSVGMDEDSERDIWAPQVEDRMAFALATGSADRCVRIWHVEWTRNGLTISPLALLDTLSSHTLGLFSSVLKSNVFSSPISPARYHRRTHLSETIPSNQLLLASTDVGTVYVWRVHPHEMLQSQEKDREKGLSTDRFLVSIVHSSDYPIINASLDILGLRDTETEFTEGSIADGRLLLATSDTNGVVRLHISSPHVAAIPSTQGANDDNQSANSCGKSGRSLLRTLSSTEYVQGTVGRAGQVLALFTLAGEAKYEGAVISCTFHRLRRFVGQDGATSSSPHTHVGAGERLVLSVFLSTGEHRQYPAEVLLGLPNRSPATLTLEKYNAEEGPNMCPYEDDVGDQELEESVMCVQLEESEPRAPPPLPTPPSEAKIVASDSKNHKIVDEWPTDGHNDGKHDNDDNAGYNKDIHKICSGNSGSHMPLRPTCATPVRHQHSQNLQAGSTLSRRPSGSSPTGDKKSVRIAERTSTMASARSSRGGSRHKKQPSMSRVHMYPQSDLSAPSLNSSRALVEILQHKDEFLEDVSVCDSVETSSTDRRVVADSVVNVSTNEERYTSLPGLTEEEIASRVPSKPKIRPQVDLKWKQKKAALAPNSETLARLTPPDPIIELRVAASSLTKRHQSSQLSNRGDSHNCDVDRSPEVCGDLNLDNMFGSHSVGFLQPTSRGISHEFSGIDHTPQFYMDINLEDVFGSLDAVRACDSLYKKNTLREYMFNHV